MSGITDDNGYLKIALGSSGTISGDQTFTGNVTIQGNLNFGDAAVDTLTIDGKVVHDPQGTGTMYDFTLETAWTAGILFNADYGAATTLTSTIVGIVLDFNTNLTATNKLVEGGWIALPAVTNTGGGNYTYRGWIIGGGAIDHNNGGGLGSTTFRGLEINLPGVTQTNGTSIAQGINITGGVVTSGFATGIRVAMNAATDEAIRIAVGVLGVATAITGITNTALAISVPNQGAITTAGVGISITADDAGTLTTGGDGGNITLHAGDAKGTGDNDGGCVIVDVGVHTGAGNPGLLKLRDAGNDFLAIGDNTQTEHSPLFVASTNTATPGVASYTLQVMKDLTSGKLFSLGDNFTGPTADEKVFFGWDGKFDIQQSINTSGTPKMLNFVGGAHTGMTAATECVGVDFDFRANKTWVAGAGPLAMQRELLIQAPTYIGNGGGALTIANAYTLYINGGPIQGANITLSNSWALGLAGGLQTSGRIISTSWAQFTNTLSVASQAALVINTTLGADVDNVSGVFSEITGLAAGVASGVSLSAFKATINGDNNDTDIFYTAFHAANANKNGGTSTTEGLFVGTGYDTALTADSGHIVFYQYSPTIKTIQEDDGDGPDITIKAADGIDAAAVARNGGNVFLDVGAPDNAGNRGGVQFKYSGGSAFGGIMPGGATGTFPALVGTEVDGATAIGVCIGALNSFVTAGSKLISIRSNVISGGGTERAFIDKDGLGSFLGGICTKKSVANVSDPPLDAELDATFGQPAVVGSGFVGILDDNDAGTDCYICWTTGTAAEWFYVKGTKAL